MDLPVSTGGGVNTSDADFVREAIAEIVEEQVRDGTPPELAQTVERLLSSGYSREEVLTLIGCALSREIFEILGSGGCFDMHRYTASLERLPALPWD